MKVTWDDGFYLVNKQVNGGLDNMFTLTGDEAVEMVKQLYSLGLEFDMPSEQTYLQGRVEAMTEHLADMRRLVMDGIPGDKD